MDTVIMKDNIRDSLINIISTPNLRPFLFRTRFERSMIRVLSYAKDTGQIELYNLARESLQKMKLIVDKSNTTADGTLRSYAILVDDIREILGYF